MLRAGAGGGRRRRMVLDEFSSRVRFHQEGRDFMPGKCIHNHPPPKSDVKKPISERAKAGLPEFGGTSVLIGLGIERSVGGLVIGRSSRAGDKKACRILSLPQFGKRGERATKTSKFIAWRSIKRPRNRP